MTDTHTIEGDVTTVSDAPATQPEISTKIMVAISKAGTSIEVDTAKLPDEIYQAALAEGLKALLNLGGVAKVKPKGLEGAELDSARADALKAAQANLADLYAGKTKRKGTSKAKAGLSREVTTEAMRIARNMVKDEIKAAGLKVSHYAASEITKSAKEILETTPAIIEQAKANIEARAKLAPAINVKAIPTDAKAIAKAEKEAAAKRATKGQLSAKQAGMVAKGKKGKVAQANA